MNVETTIARLVELTGRAEGAIELALKLKSGVLVERSPLFEKGRKVPIGKRTIGIYKPRGRELTPGMIARDEADSLTDPHLAYSLRGKRANYVTAISAPKPTTPAAVRQTGVDGARIGKTFIDHLEHRGITSRTDAQAFRHQTVPTAKLVKTYKSLGYKVDVAEAKRRLREDDQSRHGLPMIRRPKSTP